MANINKIYLFLLLIPGISWQLKANDANSEFISLPGSERQYTMQQINDFFNVPDWYPGKHPRMPEVVSHGSKPAVFACASCHLTSGSGHPESASLAGLPVEYQIRQMQAYQKFQRSSVIGVMNNIARAMSEEQIRISAEYFAALPRLRVQEVHETKTVPVTYVNKRFMRLVDKQKNGEEAIGERLISLPRDEYRVKARDPYETFITYVPEGALALGEKLVNVGKSGSVACVSCHGSDLRGSAIAPPLAGQHASYLRAQLRQYKEGSRRGLADPDAVMANNVKYFSDWEILATAAYLGSLPR